MGRSCMHCGDSLPIDAHGLRRYCHGSCKRNHELAASKAATAQRLTHVQCARCERSFRQTERGQRYCSLRCGKQARYLEMKADPEAWRSFLDRTAHLQHKRRVAKQSSTDLTAQQITTMRKQAKRCPLCKTTLTDKSFKPDSKHLDHIVPIHMGGTHTQANVRIICALCNLQRPKDGRDLVGEQVALWAATPAFRPGGRKKDQRDSPVDPAVISFPPSRV